MQNKLKKKLFVYFGNITYFCAALKRKKHHEQNRRFGLDAPRLPCTQHFGAGVRQVVDACAPHFVRQWRGCDALWRTEQENRRHIAKNAHRNAPHVGGGRLREPQNLSRSAAQGGIFAHRARQRPLVSNPADCHVGKGQYGRHHQR